MCITEKIKNVKSLLLLQSQHLLFKMAKVRDSIKICWLNEGGFYTFFDQGDNE